MTWWGELSNDGSLLPDLKRYVLIFHFESLCNFPQCVWRGSCLSETTLSKVQFISSVTKSLKRREAKCSRAVFIMFEEYYSNGYNNCSRWNHLLNQLHTWREKSLCSDYGAQANSMKTELFNGLQGLCRLHVTPAFFSQLETRSSCASQLDCFHPLMIMKCLSTTTLCILKDPCSVFRKKCSSAKEWLRNS